MTVLSGHTDQGEGADALSRIAAFLDREFTRIDHKRLSGFCPCLFAADRPACLRDLRAKRL